MQASSPAPTELDRAAAAAAGRLGQALIENVTRVVRGKPEAVQFAVIALLSGGHLLIEDVPGVGKTLLAKALARSLGGVFTRVQATPDLLPADITGVSVLRGDDWVFRPGPVFGNVVLVDEINRATPRTQSALLEAMEERQVTVDGVTRELPHPFFVVATQNPHEHAGTFPLPEGQRDRFAIVIRMGYPARSAERDVLLGHGGAAHLSELCPVTDGSGLAHAVAGVRRVHCEPQLADYLLEIVAATRGRADVALGASPRASVAFLAAARAHGVLAGRDYIVPDDIKAVAGPVLAHRLLLTGGADLGAATSVVAAVVSAVPVPRP